MPLNEHATDTTSPVLVRVSNGDRPAIEECVELYGDAIWRLACGRSESLEEAMKLTCEIFNNVWKYA